MTTLPVYSSYPAFHHKPIPYCPLAHCFLRRFASRLSQARYLHSPLISSAMAFTTPVCVTTVRFKETHRGRPWVIPRVRRYGSGCPAQGERWDKKISPEQTVFSCLIWGDFFIPVSTLRPNIGTISPRTGDNPRTNSLRIPSSHHKSRMSESSLLVFRRGESFG